MRFPSLGLMTGRERSRFDQPAGESPRPWRKINAAGPVLQVAPDADDIAEVVAILRPKSMNDTINTSIQQVSVGVILVCNCDLTVPIGDRRVG